MLMDFIEKGKLSVKSKNKEDNTPLMLAIDCSFSIKTITKLLELGSGINEQGDDKMTPLHKALILENKPVFELLLSKGADPDLKDNFGETVREAAEDNDVFAQLIEESDKN